MKLTNTFTSLTALSLLTLFFLVPHGLSRPTTALYGLETKHLLQAVPNNTDKFATGFVVDVTDSYDEVLRSKSLTL